jgi:hypothetical protein
MRHDIMVISLAVLGGYGTLRRVRVSLPLLPDLPPLNKVDSQPLGKQRLYHRPRSPPGEARFPWSNMPPARSSGKASKEN